MTVAGRYLKVINKKDAACDRAGRSPEDVRLIAVTKTHGAEMINEAIAAGATDIGENKAQELCEKYSDVSPARWHFIGHLQTNKVKSIIDKVVMIHSIDSEKLAAEVDKRAKAANLVMDVLIEVNIGMEDSKSGVLIEETADLAEHIDKTYESVRVRGLMCVPPVSENPEDSRPYFKRIKGLFDDMRASGKMKEYFNVLSMGMSGDYEVAIEEGATIVRVGSAIFGARNYR